MAFKMKGFPLRSGFKHTGGKHEDHHGSGYGVITEESDGQTQEVNIEKKDDASFVGTPVVEDDNYKKSKLKRAMDHYLYLKDQIDRGVYGDNPPDLPPIPTMDNLDDFDTNDGRYKY